MKKTIVTRKVRFSGKTTQQERKDYLINLAYLEIHKSSCFGNPYLTQSEHKEKIVFDNLVTLNTKTSIGKIEFYLETIQ